MFWFGCGLLLFYGLALFIAEDLDDIGDYL